MRVKRAAHLPGPYGGYEKKNAFSAVFSTHRLTLSPLARAAVCGIFRLASNHAKWRKWYGYAQLLCAQSLSRRDCCVGRDAFEASERKLERIHRKD
jgi:hypothetical protein